MWVQEDCPSCGEGPEARAFVPYEPKPNSDQNETEWADELPPLRGFVCTNCGYPLYVISLGKHDVDDRGSEFKVEDELR